MGQNVGSAVMDTARSGPKKHSGCAVVVVARRTVDAIAAREAALMADAAADDDLGPAVAALALSLIHI